MCVPKVDQKVELGQVGRHPLGQPRDRQCHEPLRGRRSRGAVPGDRRQIALGKPDSAPKLARRYVDQQQVHGPTAKPVFGPGRRPDRQCNFMTIKAANPRSMHRDLTAVEADLALRRAPAVVDAASAAAVPRAGKLLRVLAQHLFGGPDLGRQTEALK
jgi:hypothetical protein